MSKPVWFLSSPYTKYEQGLDLAFIEAAKVTGELMKRGLHVYSPIVHGHPVAEYAGIDKIDHKFWLEQSLNMVDECYGLIVLMMPGWKESTGMKAEMERAAEQEKPISFVTWPLVREIGSDLLKH